MICIINTGGMNICMNVIIYFLHTDGINDYMKVIMIYFLHTDGINDYMKMILIYFLNTGGINVYMQVIIFSPFL
jgi:hypothetical protein